MKLAKLPFINVMSRTQRNFGLIFLFIFTFGVPSGLAILSYTMEGFAELSEYTIEAIGYAFSLTVLLLGMYNYLKLSFNIMMESKVRSFYVLLLSIMIYGLLVFALSFALMFFMNDPMAFELGDGSAYPEYGFSAMFMLTCVAYPVVQDILFRGVVFGYLRRFGRIKSYVFSTAIYIAALLWPGFAFDYSPMLLLQALQLGMDNIVYCWCYERSSSIWTVIIFHMIENAIVLFFMFA